MSLDTEARLRRFLASAETAEHEVPTLEIGHSAMSRTRYLWREPYAGTFTDENGNVRTAEPVNMAIKRAGSDGTLDQNFDILIDCTDIEDEIRAELDAIPLDTAERISCTFRCYLSGDLTAVLERAALHVESATLNRGVLMLAAEFPRLNVTRTGEIYAPRDVPMLRGFL